MERTNMLIKSLNCGAIVAAAIVAVCASSYSANAATVTYTQNYADYTASTLPTSSFNPTPASSTNTSTTVTGEIPGVDRSPFENAAPGSDGATLLSDGGEGIGGWAGLVYTSIEANGSATYNFVSGNGLEILWGSPDSYNTLSFYSGANGTGTLLFSITGSALGIQTYGHDEVDFSMTGGTFGSVVLTTSENAFEFADLQDGQATPLPAALPLFATGLGAMGLFGWRRKRKNAVAIAA
jgi:hypothetical protein